MPVPQTTTNKEIMLRHYRDLWNAGDLESILSKAEETVAAEYIDHNPVPGQAAGIEGLKQVLQGLHTAFPDMRSSVEQLIAEGDRVAGYWRLSATNNGPLAFLGLPATGKRIEITGLDMVRIENDRIVEWWHQEDVMGMLAQMGLGGGPEPAHS